MKFEQEQCSEEFLSASDEIRVLENKYADKLVVNRDLDRKIVSFQANKSEPIFRWFHYREGFSKQLVEYVLDELKIPENGVLVDPFAGTGAAPFVAMKYKNMASYAFELMPVGAFFMKCRNTFSSLGSHDVVGYARQTLGKRSEWMAVSSLWRFKHLRITEGAFEENSEVELSKYMTWACSQKDENYKIFLEFVAFSVLERFSFTRKDGQYLRWDYRSPRFFMSKSKKTFDKGNVLSFYDALCEKLEGIIADLTYPVDIFEVIKNKENDTGIGSVKIFEGSVLERIKELEDDSVDIVFTSPPYCNRYDYTRTYALELAFLGLGEDEVRKLRQTLLTCTVENKPKSFEWLNRDLKSKIDEVFSSQVCVKKIDLFLESEAIAGRLNNKGIRTMVNGYFYDSTVHLAQVSKKMKDGAYYVMVNDNVRYNGLDIPVDLILSELASGFGLEVERIWVLPKGKGNSSQQMKKHGRSELRKCVYVWRKRSAG